MVIEETTLRIPKKIRLKGPSYASSLSFSSCWLLSLGWPLKKGSFKYIDKCMDPRKKFARNSRRTTSARMERTNFVML